MEEPAINENRDFKAPENDSINDDYNDLFISSTIGDGEGWQFYSDPRRGNDIIVPRNVYDENGYPTGEKTMEDGWRFIAGNEQNGLSLVGKYDDNGVLQLLKRVSGVELKEAGRLFVKQKWPEVEGDGNKFPEYRVDSIRDLMSRAESLRGSKQQIALGREVLAKGTVHGESVVPDIVVRNEYESVGVRLFYAKLVENSHESMETAEILAEKQIMGLHFTRSDALAGILASGGLLATSENQHGVITGEHLFQPDKGQSNISFSHLGMLHGAIRYAGDPSYRSFTYEQAMEKLDDQIETKISVDPNSKMATHINRIIANLQSLKERVMQHPQSLEAWLLRNNFPMAFGVLGPYVERLEQTRTNGYILMSNNDMGEFRPNTNKVPIDNLPVIAVPEAVIPKMRQILNMYGLLDTVLVPFEHINDAAKSMYNQ